MHPRGFEGIVTKLINRKWCTVLSLIQAAYLTTFRKIVLKRTNRFKCSAYETMYIAASFQVLTPHGVPLDNKQPKSQRSKRWCDSILLISFIDIWDLLKWVKIDFFFYQEFQCFNGDRLSLSLKWTKDRKQTVWQKPNIVTNKERMLL